MGPLAELRQSPALRTMPSMKSFLPMRRREGATLVFLIAFAAFAFVPAWRTVEFGGMAVFGWLIAALMLVSPAVTLFAFRRRDRNPAAASEADDDGAGAGTAADGDAP